MKDFASDPRILVDHARLISILNRSSELDIDTRVRGERLSGLHKSRRQGEGYSFEELRAYQPGDDVRRIDWRVSNRTGVPHIRVHSEDRERRVVIVLDQSSSMFFGSQVFMKSVIAAELAALFISDAHSLGDSVGAVIFDDETPHWYPPRRGRTAANSILNAIHKHNHALAKLHHTTSENCLAAALALAAEKVAGDSLIVLISGFNSWGSNSYKWALELARNNSLLAIHIVDDFERQLPERSNMIVSDGELQFKVPESKRFHKEFSQKQRDRNDAIESFMHKYAMPLQTFNCTEDTHRQYESLYSSRLAQSDVGVSRPGNSAEITGENDE